MAAPRSIARRLLKASAAFVGFWLVAPTLIVIPMGFTGLMSFKFPPPHWSLEWYRQFFADSRWYGSLLNSIEIAVVVTVLATLLGTAASFGLVRGSSRIARALQPVLLAPLIIPVVVAAIGIYRVYLDWNLTGSTVGFVLAHTSLALPLVILTVTASLRTMDRSLENAAASLGAGPWATFSVVTLPLILPGVLAGALFALTTSFDEVVVSIFLATFDKTTLPVQIYTNVTREIDPTAAAASTMIFLATSAILLAYLLSRSGRRVSHVV